MPSRLAALGRRLDHSLGRLYYRAVGGVTGLIALGVGGSVVSAVEAGQWVPAAVLAAPVAGLAALTVYCFGRGRRLSDLDD